MVIREEQEPDNTEPLDEVVVRTFIKKFNKTFGSLLTEQKTLISKYMGSIDADNTELLVFINEELGRLKEAIKSNLTIEEFEADKAMKQKAQKLLKILENFKNKREYEKGDLIALLKTQELVKEIQQ